MSSAYHPQTDGQTENLNKTLEMYLRCFVFENPKTWVKMLPWAQFWYNSSYHHSLKMSPFQAMFGRLPPVVVKYERQAQDPPSVQAALLERDLLLRQLRSNLLKSQNYMKLQADKKRRDYKLEVGDLALVKLQPYRQHSVALRKNNKLSLRYFGPFKVLKKIGEVAYLLQLPEAAKIHHVFHISVLKLFRGQTSQQYLPLPLTTCQEGPILQPARILKAWVIVQNSINVPQVLVQWDSTETKEATWEDLDDFQLSYPHFNLEDTVVFDGGGNVTSKYESLSEGSNSVRGEKDSVSKGLHVAKEQGSERKRRSRRTKKEDKRWNDYVMMGMK